MGTSESKDKHWFDIPKKVSFISRIKNIKSFSDFKQKVINRVEHCRTNASFEIHDWLVSSIHGKHRNNVFDFNVSQNGTGSIGPNLDLDKLLKILDSSKKEILSPNQQVKIKKGNGYRKHNNAKPDLTFYEEMNKTTKYFEIKKTDYYDSLLKSLYPVFKGFLNSPFAIVNMNARMTQANAGPVLSSAGEPRGPDRLHRDGYPPGHFKCMIYPKPLTKEYGQITINGKTFESSKPGLAVVFNPDLPHYATCGTSETRYAIEITLLRTLFEVDILKHYPSTPDSTYFYQPYRAYF